VKVGFIIPLGESDRIGRTPSYDEIRSLALQAESAGFDSVWVYDHLLYRFPERDTMGVWECWSMLTALADATERVELGTLVMPVSWRNPALLAKMAATVEEISKGRLILGLGTGFHQPEFDAFGYPYDHLAGRFEEGMHIITSLLREGKVDFHGQYFSAPNCEITPRGPRPEGPPILVASNGERMLRLTAKYADAWNTAWFGPVADAAERRARFAKACEDVGRDPATIETTIGVHCAVPMDGVEFNPEKVLTGTPEEIAAGLKAYDESGVSHVICGALADMTYEYATQVIAKVGEALPVYRAMQEQGIPVQ
jgi:alkanesulfonate monooxygenase SsuD/methylene tetrahydromethanopterin reductase-like flavin-dependent oxidoreductase (luciferase family)